MLSIIIDTRFVDYHRGSRGQICKRPEAKLVSM